MVKAPKVNGTLPHGPARRPADFKPVKQLAADGKVTQAMTLWHRMAREEWSNLTSQDLSHRKHKFIWTSAAGRIADPQAGASFESRLWRYAATTAKEAQLTLTNTGRQGHDARRAAVDGHTKDIQTRVNGKLPSLDDDDCAKIRRWSDSLLAAMTGNSAKWCESLASVAEKKAEQLERKAAQRKQAAWRCLLGGGIDASGQAGAPTRTAYR